MLTTSQQRRRSPALLLLLLCNLAVLLSGSTFATFTNALLLVPVSSTYSSLQLVSSSTSFLGTAVRDSVPTASQPAGSRSSFLTMRKQKASDRRTRRRQRGEEPDLLQQSFVSSTRTLAATSPSITTTTFTVSPMQGATWHHKRSSIAAATAVVTDNKANPHGRGRSRKRTALYQTLAHYQNHFLQQLTAEYQSEEDEVLGRIKASLEDPLGLERAGYCLLDMAAERRGNLFQDEVYRLTKAGDATTTTTTNTGSTRRRPLLPAHHKFSNGDVIVLTQQPRGSGDFFTAQSLPVTDTAVTAEARILNTGPTYIDVALSGGAFAAVFGSGGGGGRTTGSDSRNNSNDMINKYNSENSPQLGSRGGDGEYRDLRVRVDRFVSNVPYQRMVAALSQLTAIPENKREATKSTPGNSKNNNSTMATSPEISMDAFFKELIVSTYAFTDPNSLAFHDPNVCNIEELSHKLAKPPMASSPKLARQVLKHIQSNPGGIFRPFNAPQLAAIEAALSRRMCMIHGPPGSGKTAVAAAIGVGFVHQCRSLARQTQQPQQTTAKVLACAFSNVGADNLAEALIQLGLQVVRVGKSSAVAESLWSYTLDAAIDRDPVAQKALQNAAKATAQLSKLTDNNSNKRSSRYSLSDRTIREAATSAVKASIEASNIAATVALRDADVIVATSIGAADPKLLAACGISSGIDEGSAPASEKTRKQTLFAGSVRTDAPDGLPPLTLPFVILDEACQSVEPASLIPVVASNSCRALVMLGDPCQLPPTIRSREAETLGVSLMERLSATLPHPSIIPSVDTCVKDSMYLDSLPVKQAVSLARARSEGPQQQSYRKAFGGSLLLSIQYRMHPSIAALPSAIFYGGLLATPDFMRDVRSFPRALDQSMPCKTAGLCVRLIHVGGQDNERQGTPSKFTNTVYSSSTASASSLLEQQTTYWNEAEAQRVLRVLKKIVRAGPDPNANSVGIITPYNGQVQLIKSMIARDVELRDLLQQRPLSIEVKSVDGYQGRERDVIIFSAVRSNRQERIGFLHDWRRMNVALTRAKSGLVVVGDFDTLSAANKHWAALTKWASGVRCVVVDDSEHLEDEASPYSSNR